MNEYMRQAITEAEKGIESGDGGPFGAVIIKDGRVVATAHNTVIIDGDPTAHAEMNVIRKAAKRLKTYDLRGCAIYTTGEPCPMCAYAIKWANIGEVYYGCSHDDTDKIGFRDKVLKGKRPEEEEKTQTGINIEREECLQLYDKWVHSPYKKLY